MNATTDDGWDKEGSGFLGHYSCGLHHNDGPQQLSPNRKRNTVACDDENKWFCNFHFVCGSGCESRFGRDCCNSLLNKFAFEGL
jgi:hypothetical protein